MEEELLEELCYYKEEEKKNRRRRIVVKGKDEASRPSGKVNQLSRTTSPLPGPLLQ